MNRANKHFLLVAALASTIAMHGSLAHADSLVTTDGNVIFGSVTKTDTGYSVQTPSGTVNIAADRVRKILYDHPPAAPDPSSDIEGVAARKPASTPGSKASLKSLLTQGETALSSGEAADARDAFTDALALDPASPTAARGLGYSYLKLHEPALAVKPLEIAAMSTRPVDRGLTLALSASLIASHNPARAIEFLKGYLEANPTTIDEPVANALGIALSLVNGPARHGILYIDGMKMYQKLNGELDDAQSGKRRWGIDWYPADDVSQKVQALATAQTNADDAAAKLKQADEEEKSAEESVKNIQTYSANQPGTARKLGEAQTQLDTAKRQQQDAQCASAQASTALAALPAPLFPTQVPFNELDLSFSANPPITASDAKQQARPAESDPNTAANPTAADKPNDHLTRYAVAFAIAPDLLVTADSAVEDATDLLITSSNGDTCKATILRAHHGDNLALLKVEGGKFPCLALASSVGPDSSALTCVSFPDVDLFNPVPKKISASGAKQTENWTVRFDAPPRLPGGPLISGNTVVGVELGDRDSDLTQVPAATLKALLSLVRDSAQADHPAPDPVQAIVQVTAER